MRQSKKKKKKRERLSCRIINSRMTAPSLFPQMSQKPVKSAPLSVVEISPKTPSSLRLAIHRRSGGGGFLWNSAVDTHPRRPDTNHSAAGGAAKKKKTENRKQKTHHKRRPPATHWADWQRADGPLSYRTRSRRNWGWAPLIRRGGKAVASPAGFSEPGFRVSIETKQPLGRCVERREEPRNNLAPVLLFPSLLKHPRPASPPLFTRSSVCLIEGEIIAAHATKSVPAAPAEGWVEGRKTHKTNVSTLWHLRNSLHLKIQISAAGPSPIPPPPTVSRDGCAPTLICTRKPARPSWRELGNPPFSLIRLWCSRSQRSHQEREARADELKG